MGRRADLELVARGLFDSRARAQAAIAAGRVIVDGKPLTRASQAIPAGAEIVAAQAHPFVSRGGVKLSAALDAFGIDPSGMAALDVGASTGGFTDVLLKRGAAHVIAVDTGRDQLHASLRTDPRITVMEQTDIRRLTPADLTQAPDLVVIDVSFISLALVLPAALALAAPAATLVALIKPQFEVGRAHLGRGGVVRDAAAREAAVARIAGLLDTAGATRLGLIDSPIEGGDGNVEYLIGARLGPSAQNSEP
jgi:23S rRNA (cytidine1920-2'-O)/16S rRNA (cytidine1409-2'-O)-methyltransferase